MKKTLLKSTCWRVVLAGIAFALGAATPVLADTLTWTGLGDGVSFSSVANWSPAKSPGAGDDCVIPSGAGTINATGVFGIRSLQTARNVSISGCSTLTLSGGLALADAARVSISGFCTGLIFDGGTQSISGDGEVQIQTNAGVSTIQFLSSVQASVAPGVTISFASTATGSSASISIASGSRVTNLGTIRTLKANGTLSLTGGGELVNQGTISATNNSTLRVQVPTWNNSGTLTATRATLVLSNSWSSTGQMLLQDAATANCQGSWTSFGSITVDTSTLSCEGAWNNSGTISLINGTWRVGGSTVGLGTFTRTNGGSVELRGIYSGPVLEATDQTGLYWVDDATFIGTTLRHTSGPGFLIVTANLNGCTLASDLSASVTTVSNGLTFSGGSRLTLGSGYGLQFASGVQRVRGAGAIAFRSSAIELKSGADVTIESGIGIEYQPNVSILYLHVLAGAKLTLETPVITPAGKSLTVLGEGSFVNASSIQCSGGTVDINVPSWTNAGSISVTGGTLNFGGAWINAGVVVLVDSTWNLGGAYSSLGNYTRTGGTIKYGGTFTGSLLMASNQSGDIVLNNMNFIGVTFASSDGAKFVLTGTNTLRNCTLATSIAVDPCVTLRIESDLTLNSGAVLTVRTTSSCPTSGLTFTGGAQHVLGSGQIALNPAGPSTNATPVQLLADASVTLGSGIVLARGNGGTDTVKIDPGASLVNSGTVQLAGTGRLTISGGTFTNLGLLDAGSSACTIANVSGSVGSVTMSAGASLSLAGNFQFDQPLILPTGASLSAAGTFAVLANISGQNAAVNLDGSWTNTATLALAGGALVLKGNWSNSGVFDVHNAAWTIGGTYAALGSSTSAGNSLTYRDSYPDATILADASTGDITLDHISLAGVTLISRDGAGIRVVSDITLNGCTLDGRMLFTGCAYATMYNGLILIGGSRIEVDNNSCSLGALAFGSGLQQTIGGNGSIVALRGNFIQLSSAATLIVEPGITIATEGGSGTSSLLSDSNSKFINRGTLTSRQASRTLNIAAQFQNEGLVEAVAGTLALASTTTNLGTLRASGGTLNIANLQGPVGQLDVASGTCTIFAGSYSFNKPVYVVPGSQLSLAGTFTIGAELFVDGGSLSLSGTWTNQSTMTVRNGTLGFAGTWSNSGLFDIQNTAWTIGGSYTSLGNHTGTGNTYTYSGTISGASLLADASTGDITFKDVTINNALLTARDGARFRTVGGSVAATLNGCTLDGELLMSGCTGIRIGSGIVLVNDARLVIDNPSCSNVGVSFIGTIPQTVAGSGEIRIKGTGPAQPIQTAVNLTFDPGISLRYLAEATGHTQIAISPGGKTLVNNGTIVVEREGGTLLVSGSGFFTNNGTVRTTAGTIAFSLSTFGLTNVSPGGFSTLTGGKWHALGGSLSFSGRTISTIAPGTELLISGQANTIPLSTFGTIENQGTLSITDRVLTISSLRNYGSLELGPGARITASSVTFRASGTVTLVVAGTAADQFPRLQASPVIAQEGNLRVRFEPPYVPQLGDVVGPVFLTTAFYYGFNSICADANPENLGVSLAVNYAVAPAEQSLVLSSDTGLSPDITSQPQDASATPDAAFSVSAAPLDVAYQWRKDGVPLTNGPTGHGSVISGAGDSTLAITNAAPQDVGAYDVAVANSCGTTFSHPALLRICPGDLNNDGLVDDADFLIFLASYNILDCADPSMPSYCPADFNQDAVVDDADFLLFIPAYNDLLCP